MAHRISLRSLLAIAGLVVIGWIGYQAREAILLLIAGAILATGLHQGSKRLADRLPAGRHVWLGVIVVTGLALAVGLGWFVGPSLVANFAELEASLRDAWSRLSSMEMVRDALGAPENGEGLADVLSERLTMVGDMLTRLAAGILQAATALILIGFLALFLVWRPHLYERGLLATLPQHWRPLGKDLLVKLGEAIWHWMRGQAVAMVLIGLLTGLALWAVGMEFALMLGLIAGVFQAIPYFGPILSAIPGLILAMADSPRQMLVVGAVYLGVQFVESNLITPKVLDAQASLPPVLTLISTVALGMVFGPLGFVLGTPLALIALVLFQDLYPVLVLGEGRPESEPPEEGR